LNVLVNQSWHTYKHPIEVLDRHPETKGAIVDYRDLTSDPAATIERIYRDLDLPMTDEYREVLAGESKREKSHTTRHSYSLEEFGLEAGAIRSELSDLFERFQWDTEDGSAEAPSDVRGEGHDVEEEAKGATDGG
jgi:hypothetical protein